MSEREYAVHGLRSFIMRKAYARLVLNLTDEQAGVLLKSIIRFVCGETPEISDQIVRAAYLLISEQIEMDAQRYVWRRDEG